MENLPENALAIKLCVVALMWGYTSVPEAKKSLRILLNNKKTFHDK